MKKQHLIIGAVALAVVLGGGALYMGHVASGVAKDRIDGFLVRKDLSSKVAYDGISGSMFGSTVVNGVTVTLGPHAKVKIASLKVDDLDVRGDQLYGVRLTASGADLPVRDLAADGGAEFAALSGLGYQHLRGDISIAFSYDDQKSSLRVDTRGEFKDAGSWTAKAKLDGVQPALIATISDLAQRGGSNPFAAMAMLFQGAVSFSTVAISEADLTADNRGIHEREAEFPATALPPDPAAPMVKPAMADRDLVMAGVDPSEARDAAKTINSFVADGGTIHIRSGLDQPKPLFKPGSGLMPIMPVVTSVAEFLAVTHARVSS